MRTLSRARCVRGISLIETLVALGIGLLIVAVALQTVQTAQSLALSVEESTRMEQDASTAMRIIGRQIRQAGSAPLNLHSGLPHPADLPALEPVVFEAVLQADGAPASSSTASHSALASPTVARSSGAALQAQYDNYAETVVGGGNAPAFQSLMRDCLGQNTYQRAPAPRIVSTFFLRDGSLMCTGVSGTPQPLIGHVAAFSFKVMLDASAIPTANTAAFRSVFAEDMRADPHADWARARSVTVCLELHSPSLAAPDTGAVYLNCADQWRPLRGPLPLVVRRTFHLRAQAGP
ncbi:hypothetical protein [Diaphorobacter sp.]|uniref:PilW family protein n=1 Tax=Diaphorobacter sp. TaxID=1934310 RepID=UPI0028A6FE39|nr:hypothetical protein [Diaphorobacter sp.]